MENGDTVHLRSPCRDAGTQPREDRENVDEVALQRGPIVYCVEAVDNDGRQDVIRNDAPLRPGARTA
jgi:DUF1680 family protein